MRDSRTILLLAAACAFAACSSDPTEPGANVPASHSVVKGGAWHEPALNNATQFCISCHEMENFVFEEYKQTIHYSNRTGVRATCPDCHVPKEWQHKIVRKIKSTNEMMHKLLGSISTPEKYEAKRLYLAERVWQNMQETDSRECRNCHGFKFMNFEKQGEEAAELHPEALNADMTCIDCHRGIAHKLPEGNEQE